MPDYPPYVNAYGGIPRLFSKIKEAAVPPKFSQDFMSTILDLRSSSYRAMIPLLKRLGFIDQGNVPTQAYKDFREDSLSGAVMAQRLREAYKPVFDANEYAYKLEKKELQSKLKSLTGAAEDDPNIPNVAGTFLELSKLASWNSSAQRAKKDVPQAVEVVGTPDEPEHERFFKGRFGLSYTINLNLPATTEIEVFNAIFKSLRENLLREE
jgi:hypothetical protein